MLLIVLRRPSYIADVDLLQCSPIALVFLLASNSPDFMEQIRQFRDDTLGFRCGKGGTFQLVMHIDHSGRPRPAIAVGENGQGTTALYAIPEKLRLWNS
jgi:hypothetical protein